MQEYNLQEFLSRSTDKILDELELQKVLSMLPSVTKEGPWLGGGALRRLVLGQDALESDLDFFFASDMQRLTFEAGLLGLDTKEIKRTDHHTEFAVFIPSIKKTVRIQCIHFLYYNNAAEVVDSFDFTVCQLAYDGTKLTVGDYTLWDLARKRLALHRLTYGLSTVRRLLKYTKQGFSACSGVITAILNDIADHPEKIASNVKYVD